SVFMGAVSQVSVEILAAKKNDTLFSRISNFFTPKETKIINALKIFPNPVQRSTAFNITVSVKEPGNYVLTVHNASGIMMLNKQININANEFTQLIETDNRWAAGTYYLIIDDANGKPVLQTSFVMK